MSQRERYEQRRRNIHNYTFIDSDFYEPLERYSAGDDLIQVIRPLMPLGWRIEQHSVWQHVRSPLQSQIVQGWKIHVSATYLNCEDILQIAANVCFGKSVPFKFACDKAMFHFMNSRRWHRGGSGKFMTIYPRSVDEFKDILIELYDKLKGFSGPYILSDKRYKDCKVLYYRFGGILGLDRLNVDGTRTSVLVSPDGELLPDIRMPYFNTPSWVKEPFPNEVAESGTTLKNGQYVVIDAIAFSNAGGIYKAFDTATGSEVLIKEARPNTDFDINGNTAIKYREREWEILNILKQTQLVPEPIDLFKDWEHLFLVQEYLDEMIPLRGYSSTRGPVATIRPSPKQVGDYFSEVLEIGIRIAKGMQILHDHKIVIGDFSYNNVLVNPNSLDIKFIDFEGAHIVGSDGRNQLLTPGFFPGNRRTRQVPEFSDDYYALGATLFGTLLPLIHLVAQKPNLVEVCLNEFQKDYGLPFELTETILALLDQDETRRPKPIPVSSKLSIAKSNISRRSDIEIEARHVQDTEIQESVVGMSRYIVDTLALDRDDELVRASYEARNPLCVAHGALGVAYSLRELNGEVPRNVMDWILRHSIQNDIYPPGLYIGMSGIAWVLAELGHIDRALEIYKRAEKHPLLFESMDLFHGLAGFGLASLYLWQLTNDERFMDWCFRVANMLDQSKLEEINGEGYFWAAPESDVVYIGYARGASGVALFLLYLYLATRETRYLELGRGALRHDLNRAVDVQNGISFPEDSKSDILFPYWYNGSAGVGTTLLRYVAADAIEGYEGLLKEIIAETGRKYTVWPGLFNGLTGLGNFLLDCYQMTGQVEYLTDVHRTVKGLMLFSVDKPLGIAFPGDGLFRISTDFGSGSAGIALFFDRLIHEKPNFNFVLDSLLPKQQLYCPRSHAIG